MDNQSTSNSAMIALLPTNADWCKIQPAHLTLAYLGPADTMTPSAFSEIAKTVASIAMVSMPLSAKIVGHEIFGDTELVDVYLVERTQELLAMRNLVEGYDVSEFPFSPHVTIGPVGSYSQPQMIADLNGPTIQPMYLTFDRIGIWWGDKSIPFWLKKL